MHPARRSVPETQLPAPLPVSEDHERDWIRSTLTAVATRPPGSVSIQERLVAAFDEAVLRVAAQRAVDRGDRLLEDVFRYRSDFDDHPTFPEVKRHDGRQIAKFSVEDWETLLAAPLRESALPLPDRIRLLAQLRRRRYRADEAHQLLELGVIRPALQ